MEKIEFNGQFKLNDRNLKKDGAMIYDNGFVVFIEVKKDYYQIKINDELIENPFNKNTIKRIKKKFPKARDAKIQSTWEKGEKILFHDNILIFQINSTEQSEDIIKFIFKEIYEIYN